MDVKGYGGPHTHAWKPWSGGHPWQTAETPPDRSLFRTPESRALHHCKDEIQREPRWDDFKKITNPYEYVFLSWNRRSSRSVANRQPLSRSYFKMIEMWVSLGFTNILRPLVTANGGKLLTAHAAEGPGGFIEACWEHAERLHWTVELSSAITLRSDARNIPGWRKATRFLAEHPAIRIHEGADGTGNILNITNQAAFVRDTLQRAPTGVHVYTADGGFDFSSDYHAQEDVIFPLLLAEGLLGLQVVAEGGCVVLKCFDTTERATLDFIWMYIHCFREWSLVKPKTSRAGNAERYLVGLGYLGAQACSDTIEFLQRVQETRRWDRPLLDHEEDKAAWSTWIPKILQFQEAVEAQEYETIRKTLALIQAFDYGRIRTLVRDNITRSMAWCRDYGEPLSLTWSSDTERCISRETQDLLHILSGTHTQQGQGRGSSNNHAWYNRAHGMVPSEISSLTFGGFRRPEVDEAGTTEDENASDTEGGWQHVTRSRGPPPSHQNTHTNLQNQNTHTSSQNPFKRHGLSVRANTGFQGFRFRSNSECAGSTDSES